MNLLSFSTLGCPDWTLGEVIARANEFGYDALELRGLLDTVDMSQRPEFAAERVAATRRMIEDAGLSVCCVDTSATLADRNTDHLRAHIDIAQALGAPMARVFPGGAPSGMSDEDASAFRAETACIYGDAAAEQGVAIVLETHDTASTGAQAADLLRRAAHPNVFLLWDMHHPYRQGESPETTYGYVKDALRMVHVKDSRPGESYVFMGDGDIPLTQMLDLILNGGYAGPISVEWEKRWNRNLADPEEALAQYSRELRRYLAARQERAQRP